jgi:starvation-inducible DNA-binding protein
MNKAHKLSETDLSEAQPIDGQRGKEIQSFGALTRNPIGLSDAVRKASIAALNELLADSISLRDMYKKHHWQVSGPTFYQLHLLFDKHATEQTELVDHLAERIQTLGGISVAMAADVAEMSQVEKPPRGREEVPVEVSRLLEAHEHILIEAHKLAEASGESGDHGTNDLVVSELIRTNEAQVWFVSEHLVDTPLVRAK